MSKTVSMWDFHLIYIATCFVILGKPVFSITEMFEHMKNYELLMAKIANWMKKDGKLFVHIFTHQLLSYHFEKGTKSHKSIWIKLRYQYKISLSSIVIEFPASDTKYVCSFF